MSPPNPANPQAAQELGVATISDYARLAQDNPQAATLCSAAEFPMRNDGLPAVEQTYGFDLPDANVAVFDFGLVYTSVAARRPCNFAVVFGTEAQVLANKLVVLENDEQALAPTTSPRTSWPRRASSGADPAHAGALRGSHNPPWPGTVNLARSLR